MLYGCFFPKGDGACFGPEDLAVDGKGQALPAQVDLWPSAFTFPVEQLCVGLPVLPFV